MKTSWLASAPRTFSIRQTDGDDLPEIAKVRGDLSGYRERLIQFTEAQGIRLSYEEDLSALGLSRGGEIILRAGLEPAESFVTLVHENAHLWCVRNHVAWKTLRPSARERQIIKRNME